MSDNKIINVKLFGNGTLHLTGVKHPSEGKQVMLLIYSKLINLCKEYDIILLTSDINNVYLDNANNVYSQNNDNRTVIGFKYVTDKNETLYNINKKDYTIDKNTGLFIAKKFESKRSKTLLDLNGEKVGISRIELLKNKSKLYKNNSNVNFDYTTGFIYYDGDGKSNIIGKIVYEYINSYYNPEEVEIEPIVEYKYNCTPFLQDTTIYSLKELNNFNDKELQCDINCINIYSKLSFELNRQRLFNELIKKLINHLLICSSLSKQLRCFTVLHSVFIPFILSLLSISITSNSRNFIKDGSDKIIVFRRARLF